ncbi:myb family transcription factor APL isoform X2 [Cucumis melo var. makuwa]|uniref:Myb family transcription factor APL isoform X2 n=1 Tax=Cucumis melo var. makuwa TaxID=1194695 RepID=A0A5A7SQW3_CUCMM|nr:myb family transcription factor APL isoform X2 [Cucumis melo var. makuwa]
MLSGFSQELARMYSAISALPMDGGGGKFQGSLDGTNLLGDACLVLTSDPKARLRWTAELHERHVDAVTQLCGKDTNQNYHFVYIALEVLLKKEYGGKKIKAKGDFMAMGGSFEKKRMKNEWLDFKL